MEGYDAFISYSHAKDKPIAQELQAVMQTLGKPWYRLRALQVFRDDTSLSATPELWPSIVRSLDRSRYLVLLASPESAASSWVAKEVEWWLANKSPETLLLGLTDGKLNWNVATQDFLWGPAAPPLPSCLKGRFPHEPKWIDLRRYRTSAKRAFRHDRDFVTSAANFAATVRGVPLQDLLSEELQQQRRALAWAVGAGLSLFVLACAAVWAAYRAETNRRDTLTTQSRLLANLSSERTAAGDAAAGALIAIEALPEPPQDAEASGSPPLLQRVQNFLSVPRVQNLLGPTFSPEAERALRRALYLNRETFVLEGLSGEIKVMDVSRTGNRLVAGGSSPVADGSDDSVAAVIWDLDTGKRSVTLPGHHLEVYVAKFSPDGKYVVTIDASDTTRIWDSRTGAIVHSLSGDELPAIAAAFSPDGRYLALAVPGSVHLVKVLETTKWRERHQLRGNGSATSDVVFSDNGALLATSMSLWDTKSWAPIADLEVDKSIAKQATFSPSNVRFSRDGTTVFATVFTDAPYFWVWNARTGKLQQPPLKAFTKDVSAERNGLERGADDASMIMTGLEGARVWDLKERSTRFLLHQGQAIAHAGANHRGTLIATASDDGTARLWSAKSGDQLAVLRGHGGGVVRVAFTADDKRLVTSGEDGTLRVWRVSENEFPWSVEEPVHPIAYWSSGDLRAIGWRATLSPAGGTSASAAPYELLLWNPLTGRVDEQLRAGATPTAAAFDRTGQHIDRILSWSGAGASYLWRRDQPQWELLQSTGGESVERGAFSADGTKLALASLSPRVIDLSGGASPMPLTDHNGPELHKGTWRIAFSPNGAGVVSAGMDGFANVFETATGRLLFRLGPEQGDLYDAVFSPDGALVATAGARVRIWSASSGALKSTLEADPALLNGGAALRLVFNSKGEKLLALVRDKGGAVDVHVWDVRSGSLLSILPTRRPLPSDNTLPDDFAAFSVDGEQVVLVAEDASARAAPILEATDELVSAAIHAVPRCLTSEQRIALGLAGASPSWCRGLGKWPLPSNH